MKSAQKLTRPDKPAIDDKTEITRLFLKEDAGIEEELSHVYNLSGEFTRSKANKSYPVYIAVVSFTLLLAASTVLLTRGIQGDIDKISVGISDFKDLNLAELLQALKKAELELGSINDKIALTNREMDMEIAKIERESEREIRRINQSGQSAAEKQRQTNIVRADEEKKIAAVKAKYAALIREHELKAEQAKTKMDDLKKKTTDISKEDLDKSLAMSRMDDAGQSEIRERELSRQKDEYEQLIIKYEKDLDQTRSELSASEDKKRAVESDLSKSQSDLTAARNEKESEVQKRRDSEQLIQLYKRALTYFARTRGEHGYVIDPGTGGEMLVDVNPYVTIRRGDQAYIINHEDKVLALVELDPTGTRVRARVITRMMPGSIHPFDKILLKKN